MVCFDPVVQMRIGEWPIHITPDVTGHAILKSVRIRRNSGENKMRNNSGGGGRKETVLKEE